LNTAYTAAASIDGEQNRTGKYKRRDQMSLATIEEMESVESTSVFFFENASTTAL
jgi:hypothetical protein